ncbi:cysteine desulfurase family protein [Schumannella luteola]|uniref:cysteine desulfurase n=1 Tax=Schumannella luteola TaxID=472059 RepID=A0A852YB83_9MICO|nr:cysteine desulfurase family protein [Schumannella luteola]NYG99793.1 cysteine desulfurase [Schumannella luteola]TPX06568.1 cysteine desulfurase [Schumannella luteola]
MLYLDHAATSPVRREVLEAMWPWLTGEFGNPSSTHDLGRRAAHGLADAHRRIAAQLGCRASEVVLTSGGTEADNLAVKGIVLASTRGRHIVTTAIEHEAVLAAVDQLRRLHGATATILPVDRAGRVDPDDLRAALRDDTALVSIQHANNEVGTVQAIARFAEISHARGVPFHTDAVQSAAWFPVGLGQLGVDALTISGHKLGAPKGVGALAVRAGIPLEPVIAGGGQERGRRSGTENVAGAVALAVALESTRAETEESALAVAAARDLLIDEVALRVPLAELTGADPRSSRAESNGGTSASASASASGSAGQSGAKSARGAADAGGRLPGTASFVLPGISGEAVLLELEQLGMIGSSGSACAAGRDEASHVLLALGYDEDIARTAIRFTLASDFTPDAARSVAEALASAVDQVRSLAP